jgi:4-hydroxybenzoate polyprenyltransferase
MNTTTLSSGKLGAVSDLIRLPKQYGTLLVLWPTLWSLFMAANGWPGTKLLVIFVLGTFLMRSAGCAANDIADRNYDPYVERTRTRPLADGRLKVREAVFVFLALSALAFGLALFLNPFTIMLAFVGVLLAVVYPLVKRVSHLPQVFLGIAFGWGAVMAWAGVTGELGPAGLLIFVANIFYSTAYDTMYALMDIEDDLKIGVRSTAILFGTKVHPALVALYVGMALMLAAAGYVNDMGGFYYLGLVLSLVLFLLTVSKLRKDPTRNGAYRAFMNNVGIGGIMLAFIVLDFVF